MVKLLIVDDDETIVGLLAAFFQDQGYQVQKGYGRVKWKLTKARQSQP